MQQLSQRKAQKKNERPFLRPNSHREAERPFEARINLFQSFADIVKTSVSQQSSEDFEVDEDTRQDMEQDKASILYQAAQIIKNDIKQCNGISIKPLCVDDVSIEKGRCLIPESLYSFLSEVISRQDKKATIVSDGATLSAEKGRRIVMLGQDIIHSATNDATFELHKWQSNHAQLEDDAQSAQGEEIAQPISRKNSTQAA